MSTTQSSRDPQAKPAIRAFPRKLRASRWTWLAAGLVTVYAGVSYLAVDPLARWLLPRVAQNNLGSQAQVQRVAFDPWRLKLTAEGLKLSRPDGALLAGFERLVVDFEASSLLQWAWHFQAVELSGARIHLDVAPDGRFNWADLLATLDKGKTADTPPSTTLPRVKVDRLHIDNSTIDYQQRDPAAAFRATLQPLGLDLEGLSTLPDDRGRHLLQAKLPDQGGTLKWSGDIALNPLASSGKIEVEGVKLARLMDIVRGQDLPVGGVEGEAATSLNYRFALVRGQAQAYPQLQVDGMTLTLDRLAADLRAGGKAQARLQAQQAQVRVPQVLLSLQDKPQVVVTGMAVSLRELDLVREQRPLLGLAQAQVDGVGFDLAARRLQVKDVLLQQGQVNTRRGPDGQLDWLALAEAFTAPSAAPAAAKPGAPPTAKATAAPTPPLEFAVERVRLERWQARHQDLAFVQPLAVAADDITLEFAVNDTGAGPVVPSLLANIAGVAVTSGVSPKPLATLARISLQGGSADAGKRTARVDSVTLAGLRAQVLQPAGGAPLNWLAALEARPVARGKAAPAPTPVSKAAPASAQAPAWSAALGRLALEDATVHVEDRTLATPVVLDLRGASAEMRDLSLDLAKPVPLRVRLPIAQGGVIEANGRLAPQPVRADLQLSVNRLALRPLGPYLNHVALLKLDGGEANLRGRLNVDAGKALKGNFRGSAGVRQLAISEEIGGASFLAWQEVSSDSLNLDLAPARLNMGTLRVVRPVGKFIIHEDGTLNATRLLRQPAAASAAPAASAPVAAAKAPAPKPAAAASAPAPAGEAFAVAIDRVSVDNASLEFADLTLRPQFGTHIDALSGVINGLSSDPRTTAQVELDGKVDEFGSARVRGTVQPFRATEATDLKLAFRNLEMAHLTPYSGKFAGRRIDAGKLSVDLEYKIQQRQLAGQNKFVIQQLKLGERIDSPDAVNLPLDLAIAILQDSDGVIDLDLPISGSLDDPQFSYGRIVWKAITNVLTRIVTAPFRALGSLLGADADKMQAIVFDAGSATLAPQEQEKLGAVTRALGKRPGLRLAIVPTFDTARDTTALQEQAMRRAVLEDAGVKLQPGERPGPLDLYNTKVQSAIERQLKARTTGGLNLKLLDNLKDAVRSAKPEDIPRYTQMLEQLRPTFPVTQAQLAELATARAAAVRNELVQTAKMAPERVELAAPAAKAGSDQGVALQLELRAAAATR